MATYILNVHVCKIEFIIWRRNEGILWYTSVKAMNNHQSDVS